MKLHIKNTLFPLCVAASFTMTGCIDETFPTDVITADELATMESAQEGMLNGIAAYMVTYNSWSASEYTNDWGYPCQMFFREILGADIPVYDGSYSYWYNEESGTETRYSPYYTYNYYYKLIKSCNNLIGVVDPETATATSRNYLGCALTFRAMAYLDIARMYEYKKTNVASVDSRADEYGIWGLTIPIVTESTTPDELKNNPRAPFTKMYRFILTDLNRAEEYLKGASRANKALPDINAVYGLKARVWLELGSRFEEKPDDLEAMKQADQEAGDGYDAVGVASATECFQNAQAYAIKAQAGYTPVTREQWHDTKTGFNSPNNAWIWDMSVNAKEQIGYYYNTFTAVVSTEADWSMGRAYNAYRCIGSWLFSQISDKDWRKTSWIAPNDAGQASAYTKYQTLLSQEEWMKLPEYSNLKFRPGSGNLDDFYVGLLVDLPIMRVEEMKFIEIETIARLSGVAAGVTALEDFINTYRYTDGSYKVGNVSDLKGFLNKMMIQKRIEFWGEGINYFDYKRLNLQVRRSDNTNYDEVFMLNSVDGYTAPWMNFYILEYERETNTAIIPNPDTSGCIKVGDNY